VWTGAFVSGVLHKPNPIRITDLSTNKLTKQPLSATFGAKRKAPQVANWLSLMRLRGMAERFWEFSPGLIRFLTILSMLNIFVIAVLRFLNLD
jgi:hypothetical protein